MSQKKRGRPKGTDGVPKTTLHAEIPVALKQRFKAVADAEGRKITAELVRAMEAHVLRWEREHRERDDA